MLGATVTELLRTDLSQSRSVSVYDVGQLGEVMTRMRLPRNSRVSFDVAKDVATRQGLKAVLAGDISSLGTAYVLNARLVATKSGEVLWATRETASADKLAAAVDHLSAAWPRKNWRVAPVDSRRSRARRNDHCVGRGAPCVRAQSDRASNAGDRDGANRRCSSARLHLTPALHRLIASSAYCCATVPALTRRAICPSSKRRMICAGIA